MAVFRCFCGIARQSPCRRRHRLCGRGWSAACSSAIVRRHDRPHPHRRFRQPGDAADRPAGARGRASIARSIRAPRSTRRSSRASSRARSSSPAGRRRSPRRIRRAPIRRCLRPGVPVLGICYGQQTMVEQLGGRVEPGATREFGRALVEVTDDCALFDGVWAKGGRETVWMSHGDRVTALPPGFRSVAVSEGAPFAAIADDARRFYGVQFHPEVVHTPHGAALLRNFTHRVAGCRGDWTMAAFREQAIARIRARVGRGRVVCGLSGGVDSSVAAVLLHEAIGEQLTCIFVDTGLLRLGEAEEVVAAVPRPLQHPAGAPRRLGAVPRQARRRRRSGGEAQDHRRHLHRRLRGGGARARRRRLPRPGHALSRRDRVRLVPRRPQRHHQVAPQRRRPAGADEAGAGRAAARAVQGRGARARPRARACRSGCCAAIRSRARASPSASSAR